MRKLALSLCAVLALAACSKSESGSDAGTPDAACARACGTECCAVGTSCNASTGHCESCTPACEGKGCGDDGCGGTCGTCSGERETCEASTGLCKTCAKALCGGVCCGEGQACENGTCAGCTPSCDGKGCGDNGCGGSCGTCGVMLKCAANQCSACMPDKPNDKECGEDATGCVYGVCSWDQYCLNGKCAYCPRPLCNGTCCLEGEVCNENTLACEACQPDCDGKVCGDDGCGGTCAPGCQSGEACSASGTCGACTASCGTRKCGPDANGCSCGTCTGNDTCIDGLCQTCSRALCNGVCCEAGTNCDAATGRCQRCVPECTGKLCGDDGCGGLCGACEAASHCVSGACVAGCTPACAGKDCGDDGCGGTCGTAACDNSQGKFCIDGVCTACTPETDAEICARLQASCGNPVALDNCDNLRQPQTACGAECGAGTSCDPASYTCQVPCSRETDAQMCSRLQRDCGSLSGTDNCGNVRFVSDCGTCSGTTCVSGKCQ